MPQDFASAPTISISSTIAPLRNVAALAELVDRVMNRTAGLPGMATFHGPSGFGKTFAAIYSANRHRAYHVQCKSVWTRKKFCQSILAEMAIQSAATIPDMMDQIGEQLSLSRRPLIVDEADFLVQKNMIEVVRDIYESSQAAIILVGEEGLPASLRRWERVHGRMLDWVGAMPASLDDARHLARLYCRGVELADDLLVPLHEAAAGSIRRVCVSLDRVREQADTDGLTRMTRATFTGQFFTGSAPVSRRPV
jgi:DNA transposition AAA+ family ATPase